LSGHFEFEIPAQRHGGHILFLFALTVIMQNAGPGVKVEGKQVEAKSVSIRRLGKAAPAPVTGSRRQPDQFLLQ
jgi:hypothetical protein